MKKPNKKNKTLKILMLIFLIIIIILILYFSMFIRIKNVSSTIPPKTTIITIFKPLRKAYVYEYQSCSAEDCKGTETKNKVKLTKDEYKLFKKCYSNFQSNYYDRNNYELQVIDALTKISRDDETNDNVDKKYDLNNDGVITEREYGYYELKNLANQNEK